MSNHKGQEFPRARSLNSEIINGEKSTQVRERKRKFTPTNPHFDQQIELPSIERLDFMVIKPEDVKPADVLTLNDLGNLQEEYTQIPDKQKTYLTRLMGTPGKWISQDTPAYQIMDGFLSATASHFLSVPKFIGGTLESLVSEKLGRQVNLSEYGAVDRFLQEQLQNYDPNFHRKFSRDLMKHPLAGVAGKLILKRIRKGDLLGAYEGFWGSWNPIVRHPNRILYKSLGGDKKPFFSTVATMGYNGLMHVFHPVALPMYLGLASKSSNPEQFMAESAATLATTFAVLGVPIGLRKYWRNRKGKVEFTEQA
ncbi:MAG: hypothetical protein M1365_03985 [Actinobacteria bacterium]|nr:hypothetical protein [Actinomycetota bacterium]